MFNVWMVLQYVNVQTALLFITVLIVGWVLMTKREDTSQLPPGPKGFPVVGNLLSLSLHSERELNDWNAIYGPVCRLKFATMDFVILGNLDAVTEAFVKKSDIFSDRLQDSVPPFSDDSGIIFLSYGNRLKEQRKFGLGTLKLFGMGRKSLEPKILEVCEDLCERLEKYSESEEAFDVTYAIYEAVSTVISQLVFNKNLPKENAEFRQWLHMVATGSKYSSINAIATFYPSLKAIPPFRWGARESVEHGKKTTNLMQIQIDEHKRTRDAKEPRDFIDCFLQEIEERSMESSAMADQQGFDEKQLNDTVRDLFLAGSETTSTTLCWALLFLCKYPQCQSTLHKEIDEILHQRVPSTTDANNMDYAKAVIQETLRIRPVAPLGVPHVASKDGTIMGYRIKKGTCVASNLFRILHDEALWPEPERFDPSRHLDDKGKFMKHPSHIPFSIGARQCLGMQLANMELFLFLVAIFQKFTFQLQSGEDIDMRGRNIFTLRPYPFKLKIKRR